MELSHGQIRSNYRELFVIFLQKQNMLIQVSFMQACVKEALRIFSPVPMGLPRIAPRGGLIIGDRTLPEGTIVSVSPWVIHHSKELWGEDAHEFRPDRWLDTRSTEQEKYWIPVSNPSCSATKIQLAYTNYQAVRCWVWLVSWPERCEDRTRENHSHFG